MDMTKLAQNKPMVYEERLKEQLTQNLKSDNINMDKINDTLAKSMIKVGNKIVQKEREKKSCITKKT